jgi:hypothetical protein
MLALTRAAGRLVGPRVVRPTTGRFLAAAPIVLMIAAVGFVFRFGSNCPVLDEWELVKQLLTRGPTPGWALAHHNEHRYPLAKLLWAGLLHATGFDFRAGGVGSALILAGSAAALATAARRLRGRSHLADLLPAALLLHWGHWFTLVMSYQMAFALVVACGAGLLCVAAAAGPGREGRSAAWAGLWLVPSVQNGGFGLAFTGPVALWVVYLALRRWSAGGPGRWRAGPLLLLPAAAVGYAAVVWQTSPPSPFPRPNPLEFPWAFVDYLAAALGPPAMTTPAGRAIGAVVVLPVYLAAVGAAARAIVRTPAERPRATGLLAVMAGHAAVAVAVAGVRGWPISERFVTPSAVGLCAAWLALVRYGPRPKGAVWAVVGLAAAAGLFAANVGPGCRYALGVRSILKAVLADVHAGLPAGYLQGKHGGLSYMYDPDGSNTAALRAARIGPFASLRPDPPVRPAPAASGWPRDLTCDNAPFEPGGPLPPCVRLADAPGPVVGLRVRIEQHHRIAWQRVRVRWLGGPDGRQPREALGSPSPIPLTTDVLIWVGGDRPTDVWLEPACPTFRLTLHAADWLLPADTAP